MEKKQYIDFHIPFASTYLISSAELLEEMLEPAGNYDSLNESQRALMFLFSRIFRIGESLIGPVLSFKDTDQNYITAGKWAPIIDYLKEKNLVDNVFFDPLYYDELKLIRNVVAVPALLRSDPSSFTDGRAPKSGYRHGDSSDLDEAISKVIGEFLERFPLLIYRERDLLRASLKDLEKKKDKFLNIKDLAGFSDEQKTWYRRFHFDEESDFLWAEGKSLFDNESRLIPAQLIFWNYVFNHQSWREPVLRESNTNGAGGHCTLTKAILSGLYELIQRDGLLIYWLNGQAPPQIDLKTIEYEPLKKLLDECQRLNLEIRFYNTTTDIGVPSCICTVFDHSGAGPKVSMGGGCETDWDKMLLRSLVEATGVCHWVRKRKDSGEEYPSLKNGYKPFQDISISQSERLGLWGNEKMFGHFRFFLGGKMQSVEELKKKFPKFSSSEKELSHLVEKFKSFGKGYEIFYYQAEHEILKDLGYFSAKVIVPALVPLYLGEALAPLAAKRLKEVPKKLGFEPAKKWNSWPHPFP